MLHLLQPNNFNDYELIDTGNGLKLERFGAYKVIRPEPQAVWTPKASLAEWQKIAHAEFIPKSSSSGTWTKLRPMPDQWTINYKNKNGLKLQLRLGLTSFKHVGVFPEQAVNWDYIYKALKEIPVQQPKFLNLFAYTGGASVVAALAGAQVTHVDSIKQVVTWANENRQLSQAPDIRWLIDDALKFVKKEIRRGSKYHGIILDPPAFGHGANGESWKLEKQIQEMMTLVLQLLEPESHFLILNTYSLGFSALIIENLLGTHTDQLELGELYHQSTSGQKLPVGVFGRFRTF